MKAFATSTQMEMGGKHPPFNLHSFSKHLRAANNVSNAGRKKRKASEMIHIRHFHLNTRWSFSCFCSPSILLCEAQHTVSPPHSVSFYLARSLCLSTYSNYSYLSLTLAVPPLLLFFLSSFIRGCLPSPLCAPTSLLPSRWWMMRCYAEDLNQKSGSSPWRAISKPIPLIAITECCYMAW